MGRFGGWVTVWLMGRFRAGVAADRPTSWANAGNGRSAHNASGAPPCPGRSPGAAGTRPGCHPHATRPASRGPTQQRSAAPRRWPGGWRRGLRAGLAGLTLALAGLVPLAQAEDVAALASRAAADLSAATARLTEAEGARDRVAALTAAIAAHEAGLAAMRDTLRRMTLREAAIARRHQAQSATLSRLLAALASVERADGPLLLLHPGGPLGTARSGMMLADVSPAIAAEVAAIRSDLEEIALLRSLQESALFTLSDSLGALQSARTALSQAIADRTDVPVRLADDPGALSRILMAADTLDAFADALSDLPLSLNGHDPAQRDFAAAKGSLALPVAGRLLRRPGEADAAGVRRPGLVLAAPPRALVTAPWAATIRYRGPLLDYGNVIVLEHDERHLLILAGLDIVYGAVGEVVQEGAALGLLGGQEPGAAEFVAAARQGTGQATETLYLELREGGVPVDPTGWFRETKE